MSARTAEELALVTKARKMVDARHQYWKDTDPHGLAARGLQQASDVNSNLFHLIFELVQNSDDVVYPENCDPLLTIDVSHPDMLIFCSNQMPFTEKNFVALCDSGMSSKKGQAGTTGEKGLGFKSVFRISDSVYIRSAGLSFSLSREGLGPVQPSWVEDEDFPLPMNELEFTRTYIILRLSDRKILKPNQRKRLFQDIRTISAHTLLFLRQLSGIKIVDVSGWSRTIVKGSVSADFPSLKELKIMLQSSETAEPRNGVAYFVVHEYTIDGMPPEDKRPGRSTTLIQFAFPCDRHKNIWVPKSDSTSQKIFAYLPLCQSPFKFSLNADWITAANREDFLHDNDWNERILSQIATCFATSITKFIKEYPQDLRFSCLRWLPGSNAAKGAKTLEKNVECLSEIFRPVAWQMIAILQNTACVVTGSKRVSIPSACLTLRSEFSFRGRPILSLPDQVFAHKSYTEEDFSHLRTIGCMTFGKPHFLQSSEAIADTDLSERFKEHGAAWFFCLYRALASQARWTEKQLTRFRMLALIPCNNGAKPSQTVLKRATEENLFFPTRISDLQERFRKVDKDIWFVHPEAFGTSIEAEKFLLDKLQVKAASVFHLSKYLVSVHQQAATSVTHRTASQVKKHLNFWKEYRGDLEPFASISSNISVATSTGDFKPLRKTVFDPHGTLSEIFGNSADIFYLSEELASNSQVLKFLFECGLSIFPPLGSAQLKYLTSNQTTGLKFLQLLRLYHLEDPRASLLGPQSARVVDQYLDDKNFVAQMSDLCCLCKDGKYHPLKDTLFESAALKSEADSGLFLQIDPKHEKSYRKILKKFGVRFDLDMHHRLRVLQQLSLERSFDLTAIVKAYKAMEREMRRSQANGTDIRKEFEQKSLIYNPEKSIWLPLTNDIYWAISSSLNFSAEDAAMIFCLNRFYDDLKALFHTNLKIPHFTLCSSKSLIEQRLRKVQPGTIASDSLQHTLTYLFDQFAYWLQHNIDQDNEWLQEIIALPVFLSHGRLYQNDGLLLFPDDFCVGQKLAAKGARVLDIKESEVPHWRSVLAFVNEKCPEKSIRLISESITRDLVAPGERVFDAQQTSLLHNHVVDLVRFVYHYRGRPTAEDTVDRLRSSSIFRVNTILETIILNVTGMDRLYLDPVPVTCMVETDQNTRQILLATRESEAITSIEDHLRLLSAIKQYLGLDDKFREFLGLIWQKPREAIEHYMQSQSIGALPNDLERLIAAASCSGVMQVDQYPNSEATRQNLAQLHETQTSGNISEVESEPEHIEPEADPVGSPQASAEHCITEAVQGIEDVICADEEESIDEADGNDSDRGRKHIPHVNEEEFSESADPADLEKDAQHDDIEANQAELFALMNARTIENEDGCESTNDETISAGSQNVSFSRPQTPDDLESTGEPWRLKRGHDDVDQEIDEAAATEPTASYDQTVGDDRSGRPAKRHMSNRAKFVELGLNWLSENSELVKKAICTRLKEFFEEVRDMTDDEDE